MLLRCDQSARTSQSLSKRCVSVANMVWLVVCQYVQSAAVVLERRQSVAVPSLNTTGRLPQVEPRGRLSW
ncbi:hypothetical protein D3C71_1693330 [compost metagenome]